MKIRCRKRPQSPVRKPPAGARVRRQRPLYDVEDGDDVDIPEAALGPDKSANLPS